MCPDSKTGLISAFPFQDNCATLTRRTKKRKNESYNPSRCKRIPSTCRWNFTDTIYPLTRWKMLVGRALVPSLQQDNVPTSPQLRQCNDGRRDMRRGPIKVTTVLEDNVF